VRADDPQQGQKRPIGKITCLQTLRTGLVRQAAFASYSYAEFSTISPGILSLAALPYKTRLELRIPSTLILHDNLLTWITQDSSGTLCRPHRPEAWHCMINLVRRLQRMPAKRTLQYRRL
jgi:hypothetical protein